jgi:hypothetical protein
MGKIVNENQKIISSGFLLHAFIENPILRQFACHANPKNDNLHNVQLTFSIYLSYV